MAIGRKEYRVLREEEKEEGLKDEIKEVWRELKD